VLGRASDISTCCGAQQPLLDAFRSPTHPAAGGAIESTSRICLEIWARQGNQRQEHLSDGGRILSGASLLLTRTGGDRHSSRSLEFLSHLGHRDDRPSSGYRDMVTVFAFGIDTTSPNAADGEDS